MADEGQGFLKISMTILPENYSLDLDCSVDDLNFDDKDSYFSALTSEEMQENMEKFKCVRCLEDMQKAPDAEGDINDQYIGYREYEAAYKAYKINLLARPTEKFRNVATANLKMFIKNFGKKKETSHGLRKSLMEDAKREMHEVDPEWYSKGPCQDQREFATYTLFIAKIHRHCTLEDRAAKEDKSKKRRTIEEEE
ncbi:uncharacterized protein LOC117173598 [Belonocnema kinseyi]|uniref:uncharacterized protein LOC117173598 n=1 Tax=Belonocnema kinseyi TaxID=2817044 RepID=UPI00143D4CBB|nr:uncharacterized protein LOC117173598 [Belonocnema kinseyi]